MKVNHLNTVAALLLAGFAMNASAATVDGTINVSADITVSCSFNDSPQSLNFGTVDLSVGATANTFLSLSCNDSATVSALASGLYDAAVVGYGFAMSDGVSGFLGYDLFADSVSAISWADGPISIPLTVGEAQLDFYGVIGTDQVSYNGTTGPLTDTVTVTVTY